MRKIQYLFIGLFFCLGIQAQEKFNIRGYFPGIISCQDLLHGTCQITGIIWMNVRKMVSTSLVSTIIRGW